MEKLSVIELKSLKDGQMMEFVRSTAQIFETYKKDLGLDALVATYQKAYLALEESFKKQKTNLHTQQIIQLDELRDRAFKSLFHKVTGLLYDDSDKSLILAAERILSIFDLHGGGKVVYLDYNSESAVIGNFILDVRKLFMAELISTNLQADLLRLEVCNQNFKNMYSERGDLTKDNQLAFAVKQARALASASYSTLRRQVGLLEFQFPEKTKAIKELIVRLNVEIAKYKALIDKEKKKPEKEKEGV